MTTVHDGLMSHFTSACPSWTVHDGRCHFDPIWELPIEEKVTKPLLYKYLKDRLPMLCVGLDPEISKISFLSTKNDEVNLTLLFSDIRRLLASARSTINSCSGSSIPLLSWLYRWRILSRWDASGFSIPCICWEVLPIGAKSRFRRYVSLRNSFSSS